jgi:sugar O-acyltransferase (sialic acid O-acetyltransferase NeuD family)
MSKRLLILGAGGYGRTAAEAALMTQEWELVEFLDDSYAEGIAAEVVGNLNQIEALVADYDGVLCAIGNNKVRAFALKRLMSFGVTPATVIHPRAYVSPSASIGAGTTVMAGAVIGPNARVGQGCILNANATADHDSVMHDYAHLGVGVAIAGSAVLEEGAWLQVGRSAGYGVRVPAW